MPIPRRAFMAYCSSLGLGSTLFPGALYAQAAEAEEITVQMIEAAEALAGLSFTPEQREQMVEDLAEQREDYEALRAQPIPNSLEPALLFDPRVGGATIPAGNASLQWTPAADVQRPASDEDLAFLTVAELSALIRAGQLSSMELTDLYLARLKRYNPVLECVVTLTEDLAREQAARADAELVAGRWRGPLHGIPYGAKDLLAVPGYPTTWGAVPYQRQQLDATAAVVEKLEAAGAVLVAKLTLGALAWGDVWFGGQTKNPWNIEQGSSGSSAGSGSAVAAGLVGFAIGSETLGSIVSPSTRNGVTGLRPTFGRVSRYGAMALSWSMDKLGPMTRSAEDAALVFEAIRGADPRDPTTVDAPFPYRQDAGLDGFRIGYVADAFEGDYTGRDADLQVLRVLRDHGAELQAVSLPDELPVGAMLLTLNVEAAAAFDELTRTGGVDAMVRQGPNTWPFEFRKARFVPAVEYLQANRLRTRLIRQVEAVMDEVDVFVSPSFRGGTLRITNLTGHPCVCVPHSFRPLEDAPLSPRRSPGSITFIGGLYKDAEALQVATAYQRATDFHRRRPPIR